MQNITCSKESFAEFLEMLPARTRYGEHQGNVQVVLGDKMSPEELCSPVNHPKHYTSHPSGIECIEIARHMNFNLGNAMKYLWRAGEKGTLIEDLEKAKWYIEDEIKRLKR